MLITTQTPQRRPITKKAAAAAAAAEAAAAYTAQTDFVRPMLIQQRNLGLMGGCQVFCASQLPDSPPIRRPRQQEPLPPPYWEGGRLLLPDTLDAVGRLSSREFGDFLDCGSSEFFFFCVYCLCCAVNLKSCRWNNRGSLPTGLASEILFHLSSKKVSSVGDKKLTHSSSEINFVCSFKCIRR